MTIEQFIEKAIERGWRKDDPMVADGRYANMVGVHAVLLDPDAWRAVGKVERWHDEIEVETTDANGEKVSLVVNETKVNMLGVVEALWGGKTIEQYLETL